MPHFFQSQAAVTMKLVIFGLTISSSWGNGHATLWRALCGALAKRNTQVVFFEKDVPYYAQHRDHWEMPEGSELVLYSSWEAIRPLAAKHLEDADAAMVTSYCPDGKEASQLVCESNAEVKCFYDLDTPVTFSKLDAGEDVPYLPADGLGGFDLVLSYTGGAALTELQSRLGAKSVAPLYGSVDPAVHFPVAPAAHYRADFSYLGTYAADRQEMLERLFIAPAAQFPEKRFVIGGAQYPSDFPWGANIFFVRHLPPAEHPAFYCSSRLTLNVTRKAMAEMGYCPSGRLFEAAACGVAMVSDWWEGLDEFFTPGREILIARSSEEAIQALQISDAEAARISRAGREKTLSCHTAEHRAIDLENALALPFANISPYRDSPLQPSLS
jgi:spore maturation protein CgeB